MELMAAIYDKALKRRDFSGVVSAEQKDAEKEKKDKKSAGDAKGNAKDAKGGDEPRAGADVGVES